MTMPIALPAASSSERSRLLTVEHMRRQALKRLYDRRSAVDNLIRSLEDYREVQVSAPLQLTSARRCS